MEAIGSATFFGCKQLARVTVPASVKEISPNLFAETHGGHKNLYLNEKCIYLVTPGSYAETFLKDYVIQSWNKKSYLTVAYEAPEVPEPGADDEIYHRYLDYKILEDGTVSVTHKQEMPADVTTLVIPETLTGRRVSAYIKSRYTLPDQISRIVIPAAVTMLEFSSLNKECKLDTYMTGVDVAEDNPAYWSDGQAVYSKDRSRLVRMLDFQAEAYTVHADTKIISTGAFSYLPKLKRLELNEGLETIEGNALGSYLEELVGLERVSNVERSALWNIPWYKNQNVVYFGTTLDKYKETAECSYTVREGTTHISAGAFHREFSWGQQNTDALEEIILPDSVVVIGKDAFGSRRGLKSVRLSGSLKKLEEQVLRDCQCIETLHIPASVTEIDPTALPAYVQNWSSLATCALRAVTVDEENPCFKSMDGILYSKDGGTLVKYPPSCSAATFTVPEGVHTIAPRAFYFANQLQAVFLPESVHTIGEIAFGSCDALTEISMPGVKALGKNAFHKCTGLKKLTLSKNLESIGEKAFAECGFTSVEIPKSVVTIGAGAFAHCDTVTVYDSIDPDVKPAEKISWGDKKASVGNMFYRDRELGGRWDNHTIIVRSAETEEIKFVLPMFADEKHYDYHSVLTGSWGGHADYNFAKLDEFFPGIKGVPNKIKAAVHRLRWPVELTDKAKDAYTAYLSKSAKDLVKGCIDAGDMETLIFCEPCGILKKNNIDELIEYATKAKSVEFAAYLMGYKDENFVSKKGAARMPSLSIKPVTLWAAPKTGTSKIGRYKGDDPVVEFPAEFNGKAVTGIAHSTSKVPENYKNIVEVIIPEGYVSIGDYAFHGCEKLEKVTLPSTLGAMGRYAFANCPNLKEIVLPDSVVQIGENIFIGCKSLAKIVLSRNLPVIPNGAFYGCHSLTEVELPRSVKWINKDSFVDMPNLNKIIVRSSELSSEGAAFWNPPKIHAYAGAAIKAYGVRKKDIHYMTIAGQAADTALTIQVGGDTYSLRLKAFNSTIQQTGSQAMAQMLVNGDGKALVQMLDQLSGGTLYGQNDAAEISRLAQLADVSEITVTEIKTHPDGKAETVFSLSGKKGSMKTREVLGSADLSAVPFKDITDGGSVIPNSKVQYTEVDSITFEGKIFVLSGFGGTEEEKITRIISEKGGEVRSSVVVKTDYLILNEAYGGVTSKYTKTMEFNGKGKNIAVVSAAKFYELSK